MTNSLTTSKEKKQGYELRNIESWTERGATFDPNITLEGLAHNYMVFDTLEISSIWGKVDILLKAVKLDHENGLATIEMLTGASTSRLRAMLRTGLIFPTAESRYPLHYSHHEIVATAELTPMQRANLLEAAVTEGLSTRGLIEQKDRIMQLGPGSPSDTMVWRVTDLTARAKTLLAKFLTLSDIQENDPLNEFVTEFRSIIAFLENKYGQ